MMNLDHKSMIKFEKSNILSIGDFSDRWTLDPFHMFHIPRISFKRTRRVRKGRNAVATWPMEEWETKW